MKHSLSTLVHFNHQAAKLLDLHPDTPLDTDFTQIFTGKKLLDNSEPLAMLYAGYQFGHFVPQLGDGHAVLLGETTNMKNGKSS